MKFTAQELTNWDSHYDAGTSGWIPARPESWKIEGFLNRIHNAWKVLTGDYDVVDWYSYRKQEKFIIPVVVPSQLHRDSVNLVWRFSSAMAEKLRKSELKYGYDNKWKDFSWADECRSQLQQHIDKGDPLDVANYCAFLWYLKEPTCNQTADNDKAN
jgi:hypothetical protein